MSTSTGIMLIITACALVLIIGVLRRKAAFLLHFFVRMLVGGMGPEGYAAFQLKAGKLGHNIFAVKISYSINQGLSYIAAHQHTHKEMQ